MQAEVFNLIDQKQKKYFDLLEKICNIESNSADFEGVRAVNDALCDYAQGLGFAVRKQEYAGAGATAVISMNEDSDQKPLMFSGHMDTVYQKGAFGYPPVRVEGDMIYGPGVSDCKGGIIVALLAMDALHQAGFNARPIRLFLQCDEEVGSRYSQRQSINNMIAEAQQCAAFFNCETARPGKVTLLRKGILKMTVRVHGKAAHAKDYMTGVSALVEAAHKIIRLHERSTADGPTYNCTLAPMEGSSNTVPDVCDIVIDIRVATMAEAREASDFVHQVAAECTLPGASGEVIREGMRPPMEPCEKNQRLFEQVNRICARCGLGQFEPFMSAGGADASNVSQTGVPCLDSFGIEGGAYHTIKEYARLSSIPERAKVLAAVAMYYEE